MEIAAEPKPMHNDDINNHMNVMIQVDWNDGIKTWRANFTHYTQYKRFKKNLEETRMKNVTGFPYIKNIQSVYY